MICPCDERRGQPQHERGALGKMRRRWARCTLAWVPLAEPLSVCTRHLLSHARTLSEAKQGTLRRRKLPLSPPCWASKAVPSPSAGLSLQHCSSTGRYVQRSSFPCQALRPSPAKAPPVETCAPRALPPATCPLLQTHATFQPRAAVPPVAGQLQL